MAEERALRRLAAILALDVVGYSRLMEQDEAGTLAVLKARCQEILEPLVAEHKGRIVKLMGDGVLVEFASAVNAVTCAVEVQKRMTAANDGLTGKCRALTLRVGINLGDVIVDGDDLYGEGVNIAARLEEMAEPGTVYVSQTVRDHVRNKVGLTFEDLGERTVKNIAAPVRVFRAGGAEVSANAPPRYLSLPARPSIAVLPFDNMSGDPEQQYFSDGITEDIIADLSKLSGLFVIARNSSFTYRGKAVRVQEASRELGVRYVLEGSVRKAGNRVRIVAQLIDGQTAGHLWSERYDRDLTDIFAVQDEVTREIVATLAVKLTQGEQRRVARRGTDNIEAYDYYLRGRQLQWQRSKETNAEARPLLERAIELDPGFARAVSVLAAVHAIDHYNRWCHPPENSLHRAHELAQRAVALDNDEPEAHAVLGLIELSLRQHDRAMAEAKRALALDPNLAWAHSLLGQALHYAGRSEDAIGPVKAAIRLDPNDQDPFLHHLALAYFGIGRYEDAATALKRRIIRKPDTDISRVLLVACYGHLGRVEEAQVQWREVMRINPDYSLEHRRRVLPYKDPADYERFADGLRKAGLMA
jgi:adenylate cyclase